MPDYELYYELEGSLQKDNRLIPSPELYSFDDEKIYAAILNRLAQPLPSGEESPFSAQTPGSAHSILVSNLVYLQSLIAHEFNLIPDVTLLEWLRLLGTQMRASEYPIIAVRFTRSPDAVAAGIPAEIPVNLEVRSSRDSSKSVYTITSARIEGAENSVIVPCRMNQPGEVRVIQLGEFSVLPRLLSSIESARNESIITPGRPAETLTEAALRTRDWLKTGDRCVTDRDYFFFAQKAGASKVNVIRGTAPGVEGVFRDLRTVAVHPANYVPLVEAEITPRKMADERLIVTAAEIIPVDGVIEVKVLAELSQSEGFNLVATAIIEQINPPNGRWGDREISKSVANVLERVQGIYAVPNVQLKHALRDTPVSELEIKSWQLFEVQQSIQIVISR